MAPIAGGDQGGPNLLRSDTVLNDQAGELIAPVIMSGQSAMPPIRVTPEDLATRASSVTAKMRARESAPGPPPVLVLSAMPWRDLLQDAVRYLSFGDCSLQGIVRGLPIPPRCRTSGSQPVASSRAVAAVDGPGQCR